MTCQTWNTIRTGLVQTMQGPCVIQILKSVTSSKPSSLRECSEDSHNLWYFWFIVETEKRQIQTLSDQNLELIKQTPVHVSLCHCNLHIVTGYPRQCFAGNWLISHNGCKCDSSFADCSGEGSYICKTWMVEPNCRKNFQRLQHGKIYDTLYTNYAWKPVEAAQGDITTGLYLV